MSTKLPNRILKMTAVQPAVLSLVHQATMWTLKKPLLAVISLAGLTEAFVNFEWAHHQTSSVYSRTLVLSKRPSGRRFAPRYMGADDDTKDETQRMAKQKEISKQFATGEELKRLRADLDNLRENLAWAEAMDDHDRIFDLEKAIRNGEQRDPDVVYTKALSMIADTQSDRTLTREDKEILVERFQDRAQAARAYLPRFQLEGLWVGSYGDHGLELVNVTYVGDTMIASKVTGDVNVPRGQISFTADLSPRNGSSLEPLKLSLDQTSNSATKLPRYPGKGQVAKQGFVDNKFVEGQLVMFERHFSFVWIPTRHHVLFRRPTAEQTLNLLRDVISKEDEVENMREHLRRCYEMDMTDSLARQQQVETEPFRRISQTEDLKLLEQAYNSEEDNKFNLWKGLKWTQKYFESNRMNNKQRDEE